MSAATATTGRTGTAPVLRHRRRSWGERLLGLVAWVLGLVFFFPFLWMVLTSFHSEADAATNPPSFFAPLSLEGYRDFFAAGPLPPLINSATASIVSTLLVIVLAFPAAYALSIRPVRTPSCISTTRSSHICSHCPERRVRPGRSGCLRCRKRISAR